MYSLEGGATPRRDIDRELVGQEKWVAWFFNHILTLCFNLEDSFIFFFINQVYVDGILSDFFGVFVV